MQDFARRALGCGSIEGPHPHTKKEAPRRSGAPPAVWAPTPNKGVEGLRVLCLDVLCYSPPLSFNNVSTASRIKSTKVPW